MIHGISVDDDGMNEIRYAWEFLRRNTNYREDYNRSLKEVEDFRELGWYSETGPTEFDFCRRWRLGVPINPDQSFDELTKIIPDRRWMRLL